jgi:EmrB/QacA subfamily drug resistance transporter
VVSAAAEAPAAAGRQRVRLIFGALMLVLLLASLDQTIVSTALPTIVGDLGGISKLSWVVTAYLLASTVAGPVYGKLGDLYGRKIVLQSAIAIFLVGSALCGLSQDMIELIVFRALQGLGGGGLIVVTVAVVGDIVPPRERGRYQGYFGAVFGVSTVVGPLLGGFIVDHFSWRWIFYVNLPVGLLALGVIAVAFQPHAATTRRRIDYLGAALLAGSLSAIVLFTSLGGTTYAWGSTPMIVLAAVGIAGLGAFVLAERRAAEPILPLELFRNRVFTVSSAVGFIAGLALFGAVSYMPLYLQNVKGHSPTDSGLLLTPMMAGALITSIASGQLISRTGRYKAFPIAGTALITTAFVLLSRLQVDTATVVVGAYLLVLGLGLGLTMQVLVLAAQNSVDYEQLGVATSGSTLFRQIGGSLGVAAFGAIFSNRLAANLPSSLHFKGAASPSAVAKLPPAVHAVYVRAVTEALQPVFLAAAGVAAVGFVLSWLLQEVPLRTTARAPDVGDGFHAAHDDDGFRELTRALSTLAVREQRWDIYQGLADRAGIELDPPELWLLARLAHRAPAAEADLAGALHADDDELREALAGLEARSLVARDDGAIVLTDSGSETYERLVEARCEALNELLDGWNPEQHAEIERLVAQLGRELVTEIPKPAASPASR